jgi:hypothetical protein
MKKGDWLGAAKRSRAVTALDHEEYENHQNIIEKQVEVFEAIQAADKEQTVMKSLLNIDSANFREVSDFVLTNLENDGMSDQVRGRRRVGVGWLLVGDRVLTICFFLCSCST